MSHTKTTKTNSKTQEKEHPEGPLTDADSGSPRWEKEKHKALQDLYAGFLRRVQMKAKFSELHGLEYTMQDRDSMSKMLERIHKLGYSDMQGNTWEVEGEIQETTTGLLEPRFTIKGLLF